MPPPSQKNVFTKHYKRVVLSKAEWEDCREFIREHYLEKGATLKDLVSLLKKEFEVEVTKYQLEYRCRSWKYRKNFSGIDTRRAERQSTIRYSPTKTKKELVNPEQKDLYEWSNATSPVAFSPHEIPISPSTSNTKGPSPHSIALSNNKTDEVTAPTCLQDPQTLASRDADSATWLQLDLSTLYQFYDSTLMMVFDDDVPPYALDGSTSLLRQQLLEGSPLGNPHYSYMGLGNNTGVPSSYYSERTIGNTWGWQTPAPE
ncbi:hypothetical protein TWF102_006958 [Orbilia oligospora]|uniref:Clr5 domain-containing protein n=1 Tax=Orbilia oligospora TaxID=2813651 RepID=A0A7C8JS05_ORBOL|nr:hypothetical protein TWF103_005831 [Orbilia oligospora]KAF3111285.1 hypothetical protein TWF102_006958 [Orbilia oligospora]